MGDRVYRWFYYDKSVFVNESWPNWVMKNSLFTISLMFTNSQQIGIER